MSERKIFGALMGVFLIGVAFGILATLARPEMAESLFENLRQILGRGGNSLDEPFGMFTFIFLNNTRVALLCALGGFLFGLVPIGVLFFNGFIVGVVVEHSYLNGVALSTLLLSIVPHGIIEIPAFGVAGLGGIKWYLEIVRGEGEMGERFRRGFFNAMKFFALSVVMLLLAAFVEAYITPKIAGI